MTQYLPLVFMASVSLVLIYLILAAGSHTRRLHRHDEDLDRHDQEIDQAHTRIDHAQGYPYPEPAPDRDDNPPDTRPQGRHHS